jgi:hypothetical protein
MHEFNYDNIPHSSQSISHNKECPSILKFVTLNNRFTIIYRNNVRDKKIFNFILHFFLPFCVDILGLTVGFPNFVESLTKFD